MHDEIVDEEFIPQEVSPKMWWESRRWTYNKVCLIAGFFILILSTLIILYSIAKNNNFSTSDLYLVWISGLVYTIIGNIFYTFTWILESLSKIYISETNRQNLFVIFIILTLLIPLALLILLLLLV